MIRFYFGVKAFHSTIVLILCLIFGGLTAPLPQQPERSQSMTGQAIQNGLAMAQAFIQVMQQIFNQFNATFPKLINMLTNQGTPQIPQLPSLPDLPAKLHTVDSDIHTQLHSSIPTDLNTLMSLPDSTEHPLITMPNLAAWSSSNVVPTIQSSISKDVELISDDVIEQIDHISI